MTEFLILNWQEVCFDLLMIISMLLVIFLGLLASDLKHDDFYARPLSKKEQRKLQRKFPKMINKEASDMGKHKDGNGTQKRKYEGHFSKIKEITSKGNTNKKHRSK